MHIEWGNEITSPKAHVRREQTFPLVIGSFREDADTRSELPLNVISNGHTGFYWMRELFDFNFCESVAFSLAEDK